MTWNPDVANRRGQSWMGGRSLEHGSNPLLGVCLRCGALPGPACWGWVCPEAHRSVLNIRLSDERRPSRRLTGFTGRPCWCEAHWGVLAGGQVLPLPNRRNRKQCISGALVSAPRTAAPGDCAGFPPNCSSRQNSPVQAGSAEQGHGCDSLFSPLPGAGYVSSNWQQGWGKNICSYISQVIAVSADGCFLRTYRYVPPYSCRQIRSQGIPCHSCPPNPVLESLGMEWSV